MLGVFQLVVQKLADQNPGVSVSFDLMFDGIRSTLKSEIQSAIIQAERNLAEPFDIRVLKILFLVKYVKEFGASVENLTTLLVEDYGQDPLALAKKVQESLNRLEDQAYIQKTVGVYEFLTNEEKDIENEIRATEADVWEAKKVLSDIIFSEILHDNKIRFEDNKQDYPFSKKIDEAVEGREYELGIHFITVFFSGEPDETFLRTLSIQKNEVVVHLPYDSHLRSEFIYFKKTEKYISQTHSQGLSQTKQSILELRGRQNIERRSGLIKQVEEAIAAAPIYLNGSTLNLSSVNARTRVQNAFQELIRIIYPNLRMLPIIFREENIKDILAQRGDDLFGNSDMSEAEQEVFHFIDRRGKNHERVSLSTLIDQFAKQPYGWYQNAILCLIARLYVRDKLSLQQSSNELDKKQVLASLQNNREYATTLAIVKVEIDDRKIKELKDFCFHFFNKQIIENDARGVYHAFKQLLDQELVVLQTLRKQQDRYPFLRLLQKPSEELVELNQRTMDYIYERIQDLAPIVQEKHEIMDPIKAFMNGQQRQIYDQVVAFVERENANLSYLGDDSHRLLSRVREEPQPYRGRILAEAKTALASVREALERLLGEERHIADSRVQKVIEQLVAHEKFTMLKPDQQRMILQPLEDLQAQITGSTFISVLREKSTAAEALQARLLQQIFQFVHVKEGKKEEAKFISFGDLYHKSGKSVLETEQDVKEYIEQLEAMLMREIRNRNKIIL